MASSKTTKITKPTKISKPSKPSKPTAASSSSSTTAPPRKKGIAQKPSTSNRKPYNSKPRGPNKNGDVIKPDDRPITPRPDEKIRPSRKGFVADDREEVDKEDIRWEEGTEVLVERKEKRDRQKKVKKEAERRKSLDKSIERAKRGGGRKSEEEDSGDDFGKDGVVSEGRVYGGVDRQPRVGSSAGEAVGSLVNREESPSLFVSSEENNDIASMEVGEREPAIKVEEEEEGYTERSRLKKLKSKKRRIVDEEQPKSGSRQKRRKAKL